MEEMLERFDQFASMRAIDDPVICCCCDGDDSTNTNFTFDCQWRVMNLTDCHVDGCPCEGKWGEICLSHLESTDVTDESGAEWMSWLTEERLAKASAPQ